MHAALGMLSATERQRTVLKGLIQRGAAWLSRVGKSLSPRTDLAKALAVAVAYYLGAELAFEVGTLSSFFAPAWPPNMILLCALLQAPYRAWWLYLVAAFPAHVAAEVGMGMEVLPLLGAFICNVSLALGAASGLRRFSAGPPWIDSLAKAWIFILVVALGAPALVAVSIAAIGWLTNGAVGGVRFALLWGIANVLGGIALAPLFVTWIGEGLGWLRGISHQRALEGAVLAAALTAAAYIGFPAASADYPVLAVMPVPLMLWAAVRFGPRGASAAILVVSLMALRGAIEGRAPFVASSPAHTVLSLQTFLALLSAPFLVLSAVVVERERAARDAALAHKEMESILDNTPASIRVKDRQGKYIFANRRARTLWRDPVGHTAADFVPPETAARWSADDKLVLSDGKPIVREERVESDAGDHLYVTSKFALRDSDGEIYAICVVETDVSELKRAQQDVIDLSARLLSVQDEERRRIARELHDSTSQNLSAVILNLSRIEKSNTLDESARTFTRESMALLNQVHSEIHTASYLLYPPLLDEIGLAPALTGYVEGFTRRSGIDVTLEISPNVGRLERDVEVALFRIVQESLTNVHRHSESRTAEIRLKRAPAEVVLTVSDTGRGMMDEPSHDCGDHPRSLGVGIPGMRARLRQLRGTLDIRSDSTGTIVTAVVPLARATEGISI